MRAPFEPRFPQIPWLAQEAKLAALALQLLAMALLFWPTTYHRIVERAEDTERFHHFLKRVIGWALAPFAVGLGLDFFTVGADQVSPLAGTVAGVVAAVAALSCWYWLAY